MDHNKFRCDKCRYYTNVSSSYKTHVRTKKHNTNTENILTHECKTCNKMFKTYSGVWRHSKKCHIVEEPNSKFEIITAINNLTTRIENIQPITNNNIHSVNIFLNEKLPSMMNIMDLIETFSIDDDYRKTFESKGYVTATTELLKRELEKIPIYDRPIHCVCDENDSQKIVHIYDDNRWKRETEIEWTMQILDYFEGDFDDNEKQDKKKMFFFALKKVQENIHEQLTDKYGNNKSIGYPIFNKSVLFNMCHVPTVLKVLKNMLELVHIDKKTLLCIVEHINKSQATLE